MNNDEFCGLTGHIRKMVDRTWKFEAQTVTNVTDDGGVDAQVAYRENPNTDIGSSIANSVRSGDSIVNLTNASGTSLPINLGISKWITG